MDDYQKDKEEQKALAFYTSLVKSALIYYKNNEKMVISGLLDPYYNPKTGDYNILEARIIKNGWDRVACRLIIIAKYAALGSGLGSAGGGAGAAAGGAVGAIVGGFSHKGDCQIGKPMPEVFKKAKPAPVRSLSDLKIEKGDLDALQALAPTPDLETLFWK